MHSNFTWDLGKEAINIKKHEINFKSASKVFDDPFRVFIFDEKHSAIENRFFCIGVISNRVITVRFVLRENEIRILGAGYWRKGVKIYEEENRRRHAHWKGYRDS